MKRPRPRPSQAAAGRGPARSAPSWAPPGALVPALLLLGALLLHLDALRLPFFADDYLFLEQVRGRSLPSALVTPDGLGNFFRPVGRQLHFWLTGRLSGESPAAFHAVNLALFLGIVALLFHLVRRLAGLRAAAVAAGFLALHCAADVPLRWVSGCQDLLAVVGALGAIALHLAGRSRWAAPVLLLALLAKETVLLTPLIAAAADRATGRPWRGALRRAWPLAAAVAAWALLWVLTTPQRPGLGASLGLEPLGPLAVVVHLLQVVTGLEWRGTFAFAGRPVPPVLPLVAVTLAVVAAWATVRGRDVAGETGGREAAARRGALIAGTVWALAATVPLVAVAAIWSAYYYLFAMCGAALALGATLAGAPRWAAVLVVAALAAGSGVGRSNPEFATGNGSWSWQSRINRRYVDRATERVGRYLAGLRRARPAVAPRTTFFFSGLPAFLAWQAADGPLVRWAYQDTSLRSYYQGDFTLERARRGPVLFFGVAGDTLREEPGGVDQFRGMALRAMMSDRIETAREMLQWLVERGTPTPDVLYFLAWVEWAHGDTTSARARLAAVGIVPTRARVPEVAGAERLAAAGDSLAALTLLAPAVLRSGLDPRIHALMADLLLGQDPDHPHGRIEALAARALAPEDAIAWLRWGVLQGNTRQHIQAIRSLERALALGLPTPASEARVRALLADLRRKVPGGDLVQDQLRHGR